jgi:uncharacterized protein YjbI with pentapeptide repeats
MANAGDLKIARAGRVRIAESRKSRSGSSLDLSGGDLRNVDLEGADLSGANLSGANLSGARLCQANLNQVDLTASSLAKADLTKASITSASLKGADLRGAELPGVNLMNSHAEGANFQAANLASASLFLTNLTDANLTRANLSFARLERTRLSGANLSEARLHQAILRHVDLSEATLEGAQLGGTVFVNIDLSVIRAPESLIHHSPSVVGMDTLFRSRNGVSKVLLQQLGVTASVIQQLDLLTSNTAEFLQCAIYCINQDVSFARLLAERLRQSGIRCWLAPAEGGFSMEFDKSVVLLSSHSLRSFRFLRPLTSLFQYELSPISDSLVLLQLDDALDAWKNPLAEKFALKGCIDYRDPNSAAFDRVLDEIVRGWIR